MPWCVYIALDGKPEPDLSACRKVVRPPGGWPDHPQAWPDIIAYPGMTVDEDRQPADSLVSLLAQTGYRAQVLRYHTLESQHVQPTR